MSDKTPAQIEAEGDETVTVDWDGVPVTVPASAEDLDLDAIEAFETGKAVTEVVHECCPDLDVENRTTVGHFPQADGVERAIDLAYAARKVFPKQPIYILGEIIHNPEVNDQIRAMDAFEAFRNDCLDP